MRRQVIASAAALALFTTFDGAGFAIAQDTGGGAGTPQTTSPPATTPPATATPPPAAGQTTTPEAPSAKLPEVQVIQEQPKPKPKPVKQAAKPKPKAAPAVTAQPAPPPPAEAAAAPEAPSYAVPVEANMVKMSPIGSEIPLQKVPNSVSQLNAADIARDDTVMVQEALTTRVPGIVVGDFQGNQFQTNVQYRGFEASPVNGVAQGLAVYQNGVRINEAFGDTVNWDFLPTNAINNITVMTGNPVFGLNAIGGSISIDMKNGFNFHGADVDTEFGSFGRKQVSTEAGMQSGGMAIYGSFEAINDDGFRDFSDAEIRRGYADVGIRNENSEFHFNFTGADNKVGVTSAAPEALLDINRELTFTSPQTTENTLQMYSVNGTVRATDDITLSGVTYYRHFTQKHVDGNLFDDAQDCSAATPPLTAGTLCSGNDQALGNGSPILLNQFDPDTVFGSLDRTTQDADSEGITLQAVDKARLFGHRNQFTIGTSYDHGRVGYTANSELGTFEPKFVVAGTGLILSGSDDFNPRVLTTTNDYFGAYFTDTFEITDQLALTVGGRYNWARIEIEDDTGEDPFLNGVNRYNRFNPTVGLTYEFSKALNWYGGYSEANRTPTPAELACSDPENPCLLESFLTSDPPLKQVVSHTWETGFRGTVTNWNNERYDWGVGLFRTLNTDDIFSAASTETGRGFFQNVGDTLRQGVEANISYRSKRLFWYANYTFTDATFDSVIPIFPSPNHPDSSALFDCPPDPDDPTAEPTTCFTVHKGDRIPGVPQHIFKAGFDYWLTPEWKFGADLLAASNQIFFGDEANLSRPLAGYARINLHSSYDITSNVQVYGLIQNLTDNDYAVYGTYYSTEDAEGPAEVAGRDLGDNPRTVTPAIPFAAYGGIKVKF